MDETTLPAENLETAESLTDVSPAAEENTDQHEAQPTEQVGDEVEDKGNSGSEGSDGSDEAHDDRQRPSRAERRIRETVAQAKQAQEQLKQYQQQYGPLPHDLRLPDYSNRDEVTPQDLQRDVVQTADQLLQVRLAEFQQQQEAIAQTNAYVNSLDREATDVAKSYPMLDDTNKDEYDPDLAAAVLGSFENQVKAGVRVSLKEHVDGIMKPYLKKLKQTQAQAGDPEAKGKTIRPNGTKSDVNIDKMTADQLERHIRSLHSR